MGWKLLQTAIVLAVVCANIHWEITPNGYLAALIGIGLAIGATALITALIDWRRRLSSRL